MRCVDMMTRFVGWTMPRLSCSRKSRTAFPALSEPDAAAAFCAGFVVFEAVCDARLRACCWRPRAWPPFFAAALRLLAEELLEALDEERLELPLEREPLLDDFERDPPVDDLALDPPDPDLRAELPPLPPDDLLPV